MSQEHPHLGVTVEATTPFIIYLTKTQLDYVTEIVSAPAMVGGSDLIRRGNLLQTIQEAVTVIEYNNSIVARVLKVQKEQADKERIAREEADKQAALSKAQAEALDPANHRVTDSAKKIVAPPTEAFKPRVAPTPAEKAPEKRSHKKASPAPAKTPVKKMVKHSW